MLCSLSLIFTAQTGNSDSVNDYIHASCLGLCLSCNVFKMFWLVNHFKLNLVRLHTEIGIRKSSQYFLLFV